MYDNAYDQNAAPPKKGMSCLLKILIALMVGGGLCVALCCGAVWYVGRQASHPTEDPQEIAKIQGKIADIDLPDDMPPSMGMEMNLFFFQMQMVGYGQQQGKFLMLMQVKVASASQEEMEQQLEIQAQQQQQQQGENIRITKSETRKLTVDGQPREFTFAEGMMKTDHGEVPVRQVTGGFPSRDGYGYLMYIVPQEQWDEEATVKMIESIHK